jgi:hypothetical protein
MESRIVRTLYAALHFSFRMSKQMLPCTHAPRVYDLQVTVKEQDYRRITVQTCVSTFGWKMEVWKHTVGALYG